MVLSTVVKKMVERWDCQIEICGNRSCFSISKRAIRAATERNATSNGRAKFPLYPLCGITYPIGVTGHYTRMGYLARCFGESPGGIHLASSYTAGVVCYGSVWKDCRVAKVIRSGLSRCCR